MSEFKKKLMELGDLFEKEGDKVIEIKQAELFSKNLTMYLVCRGLSKVCIDLARATKDKKLKGEFERQGKVFLAFSKIILISIEGGEKYDRRKGT